VTGAGNFGYAAGVDATAHVFVDSLADHITISGDDGHHLARVRRVEVGECITAADGTGDWRPYVVRERGRATLEMDAQADRCTEPRPQRERAIAFALTKGDGPERVVAGCTELGVDELIPLITDRTVVRAATARAENFAARLVRVAREAAMQARRARLPVVAPVASVDELLDRPGLMVASWGASPALATPGDGPRCIAVGPEGGFSPRELEALADVAQLGLGPFVLRATTAALAAAAHSVSHS